MEQKYESGVYEIAGPTLTEFIREIISVEDPAEVVAAAVNRCVILTRADAALVMVWSVGTNLRGVGFMGHRPEVTQVSSAYGAGIVGHVATTREPVLVTEATADPRFDAKVDSAGVMQARSIISVPLLAHGALLGVLQVVKGSHRRPFTVSERELLTTISPHVAIAVFNALTLKRLRAAQALATVTQADLELKVQKRTALLVAAKREWESTVDAISEPLALLKDMTVTRANLAYGRKAGLGPVEVPGRKCFEVLARRRSPCPGCPVIEMGQQRAPRQAELRIGSMQVQVSTFPAGDDGSVVVHYRDVSEQRVLESRLRHSERLASLGQLASGAAHEINNPLAFVISNLRSIDGVLSDLAPKDEVTTTTVNEVKQIAADALVGAERVSGIVRALRAMARQQTGEIETMHLKDSATRALHTVLGLDTSSVEVDFSTDVMVRAVPLSLDQALGNLLVNARQAVQKGGKITLTTGLEGSDAWVRVADTGAGIPAAALPRIFDPFFTTRGVGGGVGLGLTAVWSIITALGGRVEVESAVGRGSAFTLYLPCVEGRAVAPVPGGSLDHGRASNSLQNSAG